MFLLIFCILVFIFLVHCYFKYNPITRQIRKLPLPKEIFLVGNGLELLVPQVELFKIGRKYTKTYKNIYGWYSFFLNAVNIYTPEDIEIVVSTTKHSEKSMIYRILNAWLKEGLLVSNGAKWQHRRRILTPAFHFNILKKFLAVMEDNSQKLVDGLSKTKGESLNVIPVISDYTLSAICETAMGTKLDDEISNEGKIYKNAIHKLGFCIIERMCRVYYFYDIVYNFSPLSKTARKCLKVVHDFTKRIIKERRDYVDKYGINFADSMEDDDDFMLTSSKKKKTAMLDLMISAEKEGVIDSSGIQEEVDTFMFEGHDTTATGLIYMLMELANNKDIQDKIVEELNRVLGDSTKPATMEELNSMKYLECCIKESLRLYPPVPFIGRRLAEPVVLSGYEIPANVQCHIHIFDLHRRPDLYPNPTKFDPDRFLPENSMNRHHYAYLPFSAGPRNCIGQRFAMLEMKSCVAAILRKFELHPVTKPDDIEFVADLVLRSSKPIYVKFVKRIHSK